jgi:hypothetical protein
MATIKSNNIKFDRYILVNNYYTLVSVYVESCNKMLELTNKTIHTCDVIATKYILVDSYMILLSEYVNDHNRLLTIVKDNKHTVQDLVNLLDMKSYININIQNISGNTALHICKDPKKLEVLLLRGADPNIKNNSLENLSSKCNNTIFKLLIDNGTQINITMSNIQNINTIEKFKLLLINRYATYEYMNNLLTIHLQSSTHYIYDNRLNQYYYRLLLGELKYTEVIYSANLRKLNIAYRQFLKLRKNQNNTLLLISKFRKHTVFNNINLLKFIIKYI